MSPAKANSFRKLKDAGYTLLTLVPRGWIYQNMATIGSLHQGFLDAVDGRGKVMFPRELDGAQASTQQIGYLTSVPNFVTMLVLLWTPMLTEREARTCSMARPTVWDSSLAVCSNTQTAC